MTANEHSGHPVIVGVSPGQPPHVVLHAAQFARRFDAELICAHVNPGRYTVSEAADGAVSSAPIDPDFADLREEIFDEKLASGLSACSRRPASPGERLCSPVTCPAPSVILLTPSMRR